MKLSLIVAMSQNRVIGRAGRLPWHLPADMKWFRRKTLGHPVIMGRKSFESLDSPLPKRRNIVLTRNRAFTAAGVEVVHSLDDALALVAREKEVFVIGGEQVYRLALARADRIYLTLIHADIEGDAHFPEFDSARWHATIVDRHEPDDRHPYAMTFYRYDRIGREYNPSDDSGATVPGD